MCDAVTVFIVNVKVHLVTYALKYSLVIFVERAGICRPKTLGDSKLGRCRPGEAEARG